jgi:hypothetical protein
MNNVGDPATSTWLGALVLYQQRQKITQSDLATTLFRLVKGMQSDLISSLRCYVAKKLAEKCEE